jgi:hypothetical protein
MPLAAMAGTEGRTQETDGGAKTPGSGGRCGGTIRATGGVGTTRETGGVGTTRETGDRHGTTRGSARGRMPTRRATGEGRPTARASAAGTSLETGIRDGGTTARGTCGGSGKTRGERRAPGTRARLRRGGRHPRVVDDAPRPW